MDCLEFRRQLLADPYSRDPDFAAHEQGCPDCRGAVQRADGFEAELRQAFKVTVPDELADGILLGQTTSARQFRFRNDWLMGLAATVVLGVGLTAILLSNANAGIGEYVVEHIRREPQAMLSTEIVPQDEVSTLFSYYGVELAGNVGEVTFAAPCAMYKGAGVHLVMRSEEGPPITVMYMPEVNIKDRVKVEFEGFDGVVMPLARGVLAVVGYEGQALDGVENLVRRALNIGI